MRGRRRWRTSILPRMTMNWVNTGPRAAMPTGAIKRRSNVFETDRIIRQGNRHRRLVRWRLAWSRRIFGWGHGPGVGRRDPRFLTRTFQEPRRAKPNRRMVMNTETSTKIYYLAVGQMTRTMVEVKSSIYTNAMAD